MNVTTIVLINGLWTTALSWEHWVKRYSDKGYCAIAVNWPGMGGDIQQLRRDPSTFASLGLSEVVDHYEQIIRELESPPLIIGYGFGGLVTQILLDRGWGAAGVTIASAPVKGGFRLPLSTLKIAFSALGNPFNSHETTSLTPKQFHRAFANSLTENESLEAFERYTVPVRIGFCCRQHSQISFGKLQSPSTLATTRARRCSWSRAAGIASRRPQWSKQTSTFTENRKPKPITKNFPPMRISRSFRKLKSRTTCSVGRSTAPMGRS